MGKIKFKLEIYKIKYPVRNSAQLKCGCENKLLKLGL